MIFSESEAFQRRKYKACIYTAQRKASKNYENTKDCTNKKFYIYLQKFKTSSCDTVPLDKEIDSTYRRQETKYGMGGGGGGA
jgi:hypothetical protein